MRKDKKKVTSTAVALTLCGVLMLSGTLAWSSLKQTAKNEIMGGKLKNPGGRLHDDFNGNTGLKNIYVENFTGTLDGQELIVRVRLREYEAIGETNVEQREEDTSQWDIFNLNNGTGHFGHWNWIMGGDTVYMPTFNKNKDSQKSDLNGTYEGTTPGDTIYFDDFKSYEEGEKKKAYAKYDDDEDNDIEDANIKEVEETHTAKKTLSGTVYTLAEWKTLDEDAKTGNFWVYGDDGWAYWANPLLPQSATAPLLSAIGMNPDNPITEEWYYGIYVESQMVTADEITDEKKEAGDGFYQYHTAGADACDGDCQGECPSENMQMLLEAIAAKCSKNAGTSAIWLSDEDAGIVRPDVEEDRPVVLSQSAEEPEMAVAVEGTVEGTEQTPEENAPKTEEQTPETEEKVPVTEEQTPVTEEQVPENKEENSAEPEQPENKEENSTASGVVETPEQTPAADAGTEKSAKDSKPGVLDTLLGLFKGGVQ